MNTDDLIDIISESYDNIIEFNDFIEKADYGREKLLSESVSEESMQIYQEAILDGIKSRFEKIKTIYNNLVERIKKKYEAWDKKRKTDAEYVKKKVEKIKNNPDYEKGKDLNRVIEYKEIRKDGILLKPFKGGIDLNVNLLNKNIVPSDLYTGTFKTIMHLLETKGDKFNYYYSLLAFTGTKKTTYGKLIDYIRKNSLPFELENSTITDINEVLRLVNDKVINDCWDDTEKLYRAILSNPPKLKENIKRLYQVIVKVWSNFGSIIVTYCNFIKEADNQRTEILYKL